MRLGLAPMLVPMSKCSVVVVRRVLLVVGRDGLALVALGVAFNLHG